MNLKMSNYWVHKSITAICLMTLYVPAQEIKTAPVAHADGKDITGYDISSVKINTSDNELERRIAPSETSFQATRVPLSALLAYAYGLRESQIRGLPKWANSINFDVIAKASGSNVEQIKKLTSQERRGLLLPVLFERFQLHAHVATNISPVYNLVVTKSGAKLKPAGAVVASSGTKDDPLSSLQAGNLIATQYYLYGKAIPLSILVKGLAQVVDRNVIDRTGYSGVYDVIMNYSPPNLAAGESAANAGSFKNQPEIFTAIQEQLGLRLVSAKGPGDVLVVDHVQLPNAN